MSFRECSVLVGCSAWFAIRSDELNAAAGGYTGSPWPPLELDPVGWGRKLYPPGAPRTSGNTKNYTLLTLYLIKFSHLPVQMACNLLNILYLLNFREKIIGKSD